MKLSAKDYLVFQDTTQGQLILQDLVNKFGGAIYVKGGQEAARQTDFNCGCRAVLDYILGQIEVANNGDMNNG